MRSLEMLEQGLRWLRYEHISYNALKASNIPVPQSDPVELYGLSFRTYVPTSHFPSESTAAVVGGFLSERFRIFLRC